LEGAGNINPFAPDLLEPVVWVDEFLIVDFCWLHENDRAPGGVNSTSEAINNGILGRRLMVGQVPLEHFV
jgi:hypothetical protein